MTFTEIRDKLLIADEQALQDWRDASAYRHYSIEDHVAFIEYRRSLLAGAVGLILSELIAREGV